MSPTFALTIIGSNSAISAFDRYPTAQILQIHQHLILIDCGEGTQFRLDKFRIKKNAIESIFISHLHGDHYFGLIGLLTSFNLSGRTAPINLFGPRPHIEILHLQLKHNGADLRYPLVFHATDTNGKQLIYENSTFEVISFPLQHRIPTTGFLFIEKPSLRNVMKEKIDEYGLRVEQIVAIKKGQPVIDHEGNEILAETFLYPPTPCRSYAYCSDTLYDETLIEILKNVSLLYHEATFEKASAALAQKTMHSTSEEAALIAKKSGAKQLLIGHFSSRYKHLAPILAEAKAIFDNTYLATEGDTFSVAYEQIADQLVNDA
jgi:ribonuclease Z